MYLNLIKEKKVDENSGDPMAVFTNLLSDFRDCFWAGGGYHVISMLPTRTTTYRGCLVYSIYAASVYYGFLRVFL